MMHQMTTTKKLKDLQIHALANKIPILSDDGLLFLVETLKKRNAKRVLEIGTATGYSAISMALLADVSVTTVERDLERFVEAEKNVAAFGLESEVKLIFADALTLELDPQFFDVIFIDAAKAQYEKFFNIYKKYLAPKGAIVTDNLNFHNLSKDKVSRSTRNLLKRIEDFKAFLLDNEEFITTVSNIGDGMSISERRFK